MVKDEQTASILRRWPIGVIAAASLAVAGVGAGVVVAVSGGSKKPEKATLASKVASSGLPKSRSSEQATPGGEAAGEEADTNSGTTHIGQSPKPVTPLTALDSYWADIRAHRFAGAYAYLAPGALEQSESQFVASERASQIKGVEFHGNLMSSSELTATVEVTSLITHDERFGCRSWTGSYEMTGSGSGWRISKANLSPHSCSG